MKINDFRGALTDSSANKGALVCRHVCNGRKLASRLYHRAVIWAWAQQHSATVLRCPRHAGPCQHVRGCNPGNFSGVDASSGQRASRERAEVQLPKTSDTCNPLCNQCFLAGISFRSSRKLFKLNNFGVTYYLKKWFWIKVSNKTIIFNFENRSTAPHQWFVFQIKSHVFKIRLYCKYPFYILQITNSRGDLTNISAKTKIMTPNRRAPHVVLWYFDPIYYVFCNKNKYHSGWPNWCYG